MMYIVTEQTKTVDDREALVYGIRYNSEYCVPDISPDKAAVEDLAKRFNACELSPCQLLDAALDFVNT